MADLEKVIKAIEICYTVGHDCTECPLFLEDDCNDKLMHDVLDLLKKQEAVLLKDQHKNGGHIINANSPWKSRCPRCGKKIEGRQTRFCKYCGQGVRWE